MTNLEISNRVRQCMSYDHAWSTFERLANQPLMDAVTMYFSFNHVGEITIDLLADVIANQRNDYGSKPD